MENVKKMVLVEPSVIEKLTQHNNVENPKSRLDAEMQKILESNMEDTKKCILYLQILRRYLHFTQEDRQPIELPIITENINNMEYNNSDTKNKNLVSTEVPSHEVKEQNILNNKTRYTSTEILSLIPKSYLQKGEMLLNLISLSKNTIDWDNEGTVIVNNEKILGSNIVDLINDSLRPLKRSDPIGWKKFAEALTSIKIPLSYIGNPKRSEFIHQLQLNKLEGNYKSNKETLVTPNSRGDRSMTKIKKKIDWEKWTPY